MFPSYVGAEADEFGITTVDYAYIFRVMERIAAVVRDGGDAQAMVHCEEPTICGMLKERYRSQGHDELYWWTRARPAGCEAMQIFDVGMIAKRPGLGSTFRTSRPRRVAGRSNTSTPVA